MRLKAGQPLEDRFRTSKRKRIGQQDGTMRTKKGKKDTEAGIKDELKIEQLQRVGLQVRQSCNSLSWL